MTAKKKQQAKSPKRETRPEKLFDLLGKEVALWSNVGARMSGKLQEIHTKRIPIGSLAPEDNEEHDYIEIIETFVVDDSEFSYSNLDRIEKVIP